MKNWREEILKYFINPMPELTIIADPDGLFSDAKILYELSARGIEVVQYADPISFRYIYESRFRGALEKKPLHLAVRVAQSSYDGVPYDVLRSGSRRDFSLNKLFPKFSHTILQSLDNRELDAVSRVYDDYSGSNSDTDTSEYVLKSVYKIYRNNVKTQSDLLRLLLSLYSEGYRIPNILAAYLVDKWGIIPTFKELQIKELLCSEQFFLQYLQTEWNTFIADLKLGLLEIESSEGITKIETQYPIADKNVRILLEKLFADRKLSPVPVDNPKLIPGWASFGIEYDEAELIRSRLLDRILSLSDKLNEYMGYKDWINIAMLFSEIKEKALALKEGKDIEVNSKLAQLQLQIDQLFSKWVLSKYNTLYNLPYLPNPVMVHHIPHFLASIRHDDKIALIVLDGMSFIQWQQIREVLKSSFEFQQNGIFAWIPTITSVSRQAIFCGERPDYYANSINTTTKEEQHWQLFWGNQGVSKMYIEYIRISNYPTSFDEFKTIKQNNRVKAVVVDLIDQLVHTAIQGNRGLYEEVNVWLKTGFLENMIRYMIDGGYQVFLTSDHGNRECTGTGKISEGVLAHTRGQRVRLYNSKIARDQAALNHKSILWDSPGLPDNMHTLLAPVAGAFVAEGEEIISHGSLALEEVIVPFIRVITK